MIQVKYCKDCKHCKPETGFEWNLRCHHPVINSDDEWALSSVNMNGTNCRDERKIAWFAKCGKSGKLFEAKLLKDKDLEHIYL